MNPTSSGHQQNVPVSIPKRVGQVARLALALALTVLTPSMVAPATSARETDANMLLVEAGRLILDARETGASPEDRIGWLELAHDKLKRIIDEHPSSDVAVKLVTGQGLGSISLEAIDRALVGALDACWRSTSVTCVSRLAVDVALAEGYCPVGVSLLNEVAMAQASIGDVANARRSLDLANRRISSCEYYNAESLQWAYLEIVEGHLAVKQFDKAVETARLVISMGEETSAAISVLRMLSSTELDMSQFAAVVALAREVKDSDRAYDAIAMTLSQQGAFHQAHEAADQIRDPLTRSQAIIRGALAHTDTTEEQEPIFQEARAAAGLIEDDVQRLESIIKIALAQADASADSSVFLAEALAAAHNVRDGYKRARRLVDVALAQGRAGKADDGLATLASAEDAIPQAKYGESPKDAYWRSRFWISVASAHAELGDNDSLAEAIENALKHIQAVDQPESRSDLLGRAASVNAESARPQAAAEIAERIPDTNLQKARVYAKIGASHHMAGDRRAARDAFASAIHKAEAVEEPYQRLHAYWSVVSERASSRYLRVRDTTAAIAATGDKIKDEGRRALARSLVLLANARISGSARSANQELESILRTASETDDEALKVDLQLSVSAVQRVLGRFSDALATARLIDNPARRAHAIGRVAVGQVDARMFDAAKETAGQIRRDPAYVTLSPTRLAEAASDQLQAGRVNDADVLLLLAADKLVAGSYYPVGWADVARVEAKLVNPGRAFLGIKWGEETLVSNVFANSSAAVAGIKPGDRIVLVDGEQVTNRTEASSRINRVTPGSRMVFGIQRDGEKREIEVVLGDPATVPRSILDQALALQPITTAQNLSSTLAYIASAYVELGSARTAESILDAAFAAARSVGVQASRRAALAAIAAAQERAGIDSTATIDALHDMLVAMIRVEARTSEVSQEPMHSSLARDAISLAVHVVARKPEVLDQYVAFARKHLSEQDSTNDGLWEIAYQSFHLPEDQRRRLLLTLSPAATEIAHSGERTRTLVKIANLQVELGALRSAIATLDNVDIVDAASIPTLVRMAEAFAAVGSTTLAKAALRRALAMQKDDPSAMAFGSILDAAQEVAAKQTP